jgi:eukaryotic-like serine/threonine-protein kinase
MSSAPDDTPRSATDETPHDEAHDLPPERAASLPDDPSGQGDLLGRTIGGRYVIERQLGVGAIGRSYRARSDSGTPVALKLLHESLRADETFKRRLLRDVDAAGKLEHLHVARLVEQGRDEREGPFIARELIEGQDLLAALQHGPLTPRRICELLMQLLSALSEAQRHGVLHRNLKPQNVLVMRDPNGRECIKVCDFGNPQRARPGAEYMAPEQANGQAIDGQADVYAVGVILYELLTGEVPFRGASPEDTLALHRTQPVEPPRQKRPERHMPRELEAVCLKALAKDPRERHKSPREMSQALRAVVSLLGLHADESLGSSSFADGNGATADPSAGERMTMPGEQLRSRTKFWLGAALLAAVCAAVMMNPAVEQAGTASVQSAALSGAKQNGAAALERGHAKMRAGDARAAIVELRNARRALGDSPEVLRSLGEALVIDGTYEEGSELLTHYLALEPAARDRAFVESLLRRAAKAR